MNKYQVIWSLNHNIFNNDILRYITTFIFYKPITRIIMLFKIKNKQFKDIKDGYGSIENWNVLHVINMSKMFYCCNNFNQKKESNYIGRYGSTFMSDEHDLSDTKIKP